MAYLYFFKMPVLHKYYQLVNTNSNSHQMKTANTLAKSLLISSLAVAILCFIFAYLTCTNVIFVNTFFSVEYIALNGIAMVFFWLVVFLHTIRGLGTYDFLVGALRVKAIAKGPAFSILHQKGIEEIGAPFSCTNNFHLFYCIT